MQKEVRERSWGTYIKEEDQERDIADMPEEKTVAKGTRVGWLSEGGNRGDASEAEERGSERRCLGRDRGVCSQCTFLMGSEAGPADQGRGR